MRHSLLFYPHVLLDVAAAVLGNVYTSCDRLRHLSTTLVSASMTVIIAILFTCLAKDLICFRDLLLTHNIKFTAHRLVARCEIDEVELLVKFEELRILSFFGKSGFSLCSGLYVMEHTCSFENVIFFSDPGAAVTAEFAVKNIKYDGLVSIADRCVIIKLMINPLGSFRVNAGEVRNMKSQVLF